MSAEIRKTFPEAEVKLIPSGGGVFEVMKEGRLVFSKKRTGRFPDPGELTRPT